ncbi:MAG: nucleotidyltransferase substrate binding protein [Deltaproteobacteria bacterium]|nr:nucleotidyltransferase substrate binding protein [Deltaproteobacteria bacterium]
MFRLFSQRPKTSYSSSLNNNLDLFNVKDIFREAGKQGFIDKVESWFEYLEARNLTSHTYDEAIADKVYARAKEFELEASLLLQKIKKILK